jgi:glucokinase
MSVVVAVDVGGTSVKGALVDATGQLSHETVFATPVADGPDAVVAAVRSAVRSLAGAGADVAAVGLVVPGDVDAGAGVARFAANVGWRDAPLRALVRDDLGLPTVLDHDVRAAGLAEREIGGVRGVADSLVAVIGTGIAGVITSAGQHVPGARRLAGELGHMPVRPDGEPCPCGQRGCLERYASAAALARRYAERTGVSADAEAILARLPGDQAAAAVWDEAVEALAIAFASCAMLLDPAVILLSGGLSQAGPALLDPLRTAVAERVVWRECPALELSPLGARAGLLGAALLAWRAAGVVDFASWTHGLPR